VNNHQFLAHHTAYAKKHDYDLRIDYEAHDPQGIFFNKWRMMEEVIDAKTHEWIWWMDFDTLITNMTIPLTDIIEEELALANVPDDIDFFFSHDW
jgi:mannan polymerase II complex MNN10 subunit